MMTFPGLFQALRQWVSGIFSLLAVLLMSSVLLSAAHAQAPEPAVQAAPAAVPPLMDVAKLLSVYKLAAGDVITIRVFGEDDLSREKIRLSDAGTIPYPVLGEVKALGLTIGDIERTITKGLDGRYLINPRVSVTIEEYRPFYINGMVERPGGYPFQPGLTVLKAASLAGGLQGAGVVQQDFDHPRKRPQEPAAKG
jgi:protein involved in polysaccharide export with SLBB domain